ncbi:MAG: hypothetical protein Q9228_006379 [Teloschistes exilis]
MRNSNRLVASRKGVSMLNASPSRKEIDASKQNGKQSASGAKMTILELVSSDVSATRGGSGSRMPKERGDDIVKKTEIADEGQKLMQERESDATGSYYAEPLKHWLKESYEKKPTCAVQSAEGKKESEKI